MTRMLCLINIDKFVALIGQLITFSRRFFARILTRAQREGYKAHMSFDIPRHVWRLEVESIYSHPADSKTTLASIEPLLEIKRKNVEI